MLLLINHPFCVAVCSQGVQEKTTQAGLLELDSIQDGCRTHAVCEALGFLAFCELLSVTR